MTERLMGKLDCFMFLMLLHPVFSAIDVPPINSYGMQGDNLNLSCTLNSPDSLPFEWRFFEPGFTGGIRIYTQPEVDPIDSTKYAIHGYYNLMIKNLDWQSEGGEYGCKDWETAAFASAHVFIFENYNQTAPTVRDGEVVELLCTSRFGASPDLKIDPDISVPVMTMDVGGTTLSNVMTNLSDSPPWILSGSAQYTTQASDDEEDFGCTITIQQPVVQIRQTIKMDVQYEVNVPIFQPNNTFYYVGEYINCYTEGNPDPTYKWISIESPVGSGVTINGHQLQITSDMLSGQPGISNIWECTATNVLESNPTSQTASISFEVQPGERPPGEETAGGQFVSFEHNRAQIISQAPITMFTSLIFITVYM